ncbi:hypothetical protein [Kangiella shandongensis]|uniref:hypothetical protein n=1 Tax=Kangiella shandongensis TaxID=2763258 RepID=UPI001CBFA842|nr:hypothetical protein [Kangiella shandongensis]
MSKETERELLQRLKSEFGNAAVKSPGIEQDAVFQAQLEQHGSEANEKEGQHHWFAAAVAVLVIGLTTVIGYQYIGTSDGKDSSLNQLIAQANAIEQQLSEFEMNRLSSAQYVEALKLRDEIGMLDESLNQLYSAGPGVSKAQLHQVWEEKLEITKSLRAMYTNQYRVARI